MNGPESRGGFFTPGFRGLDMPAQISDEQIQTIKEMGKDPAIVEKKAIAEEVGVSRATVNKYLDEWNADLDAAKERNEAEQEAAAADGGDGDEEEENSFPEGFTSEPPGGAVEDTGPDFGEMSKSDFILWFFDKRGHGVDSNFARRVADQCDVRDELPNADAMKHMILEDKSRIKNEHAASVLADNYSAARERYFEANGGRSSGGSRPGSWTSGPSGGQQGGGQSSPGTWGNGQQSNGQSSGGGQYARSDGAGSGSYQDPNAHVNGQGQQPQPQQPQPAGDRRVDQLQDELNDLKRQQYQLLQQLREGQGDGKESLKSQIEEIAEISNTLETIQGKQAGGGDEQIEALQAQLQEMRRQLNEEAEGGQMNFDGEGGGMGALVQLAANDDIDPEMMSILAESVGVTDPELKRVEYEHKREMEKTRRWERIIDGVFDNLGNVSGDLVETAMAAMSGDGQQQQQQQDQGNSQLEVGNEMHDEGQIQVVGEDVGTDEPDRGGGRGRDRGGGGGSSRRMSPTRRKHAEKVEGQDDGGVASTGGFRGPTDQPRSSSDAGGQNQKPEPDAGGPDEMVFEECQYIDDDGNPCEEPTGDHPALCPQHADIVEG